MNTILQTAQNDKCAGSVSPCRDAEPFSLTADVVEGGAAAGGGEGGRQPSPTPPLVNITKLRAASLKPCEKLHSSRPLESHGKKALEEVSKAEQSVTFDSQKSFTKFRLREVSQGLLAGDRRYERILTCGRNPSNLVLDMDTKQVFIRDNRACGSIIACPVCGDKISLVRCNEITEGTYNFLDGITSTFEGYAYDPELASRRTVAMMVLNHSHTSQDTLQSLHDRAGKARMDFWRQRIVRETLSRYGLVGRISSFEITWSTLNGFHPHEHILLYFESSRKLYAEDFEVLRIKLFPYWRDACKKYGLTADFERFFLQGTDCKKEGEIISGYVSKLSRELSLKNLKKAHVVEGRNGQVAHYSPWQMVYAVNKSCICSNQKMHRLDDGVLPLAKGFIELVHSMRGKPLCRWSNGLAGMLNVHTKTDEEIIEEEAEDSSHLIFEFSSVPHGWDAWDARGCLEALHNENAAGLIAYLDTLCGQNVNPVQAVYAKKNGKDLKLDINSLRELEKDRILQMTEFFISGKEPDWFDRFTVDPDEEHELEQSAMEEAQAWDDEERHNAGM